MIEYLNGKVQELTPTYAVVECGGGVGYIASITLNTFSALQGVESAKLFIHEAIREDAYQLFGFLTAAERAAFRLLISVSGVGANTARVILSALTPAELQTVVMAEDVKSLKSVKGIGQKGAERIIVELKDKMSKMEFGIDLSNGAPAVAVPAASSLVKEEALQALEVMGYNKAQAAKAIDKILADNPDQKVEAVVRAAFRML